MTDLTPVRLSVEGIGGVACDVSLKGNVTVVFVTDKGENKLYPRFGENSTPFN